MSMNHYLCPTPREFCTGKLTSMNNFFNQTKNAKLHGSRDAAFDCFTAYLVRTGHERVAPREYRQPQGGILLLSKRSKFGVKLRLGKEGTRFMVLRHNGCIVST